MNIYLGQTIRILNQVETLFICNGIAEKYMTNKGYIAWVGSQINSVAVIHFNETTC